MVGVGMENHDRVGHDQLDHTDTLHSRRAVYSVSVRVVAMVLVVLRGPISTHPCCLIPVGPNSGSVHIYTQTSC